MHRILVPIDSQDPESWQYALAYADKIAEQSSQRADVILLIHTKQQLDRTSLGGHIGTTAAKALSKGKSIQLQSGANLSVKTLKTVGQTYRGGIVRHSGRHGRCDVILLRLSDTRHRGCAGRGGAAISLTGYCR